MNKWERKSLNKVTGKWLKEAFTWLWKHEDQGGCYSVQFGSSGSHDVSVCVGWTNYDDEWKVAWKIGWQAFNNAMQTDLDIDFDMPWNTEAYCDKMNARLKAEGKYSKYNRYVEGDVYDTEETIGLKPGKTTPLGYRDWNALAAYIRKTARNVLAFAREVDPIEEE